MTKKFDGWWIVATCFFTFGISTGLPYYNVAFFFDYFRDDHSWPISFVTLGAPVAVLLTIWVGPVIVPRVSPRLLIIIGTGMTFLSFQWFSRLSGAQWEYFGAWSLYMIGYFISGPIPHQIIISNWFKEKRGRAMGITYVGVAIVGSLGNKLGPWLSKQMPYTDALHYMSFILLLAWPLLFALLILWERRHPDPYIDLGLFRNRTFNVASLCAGLRMALMTSVSFLIPLYVSDVHGGSASVIGIVLMLQAGMLFVTSRAGGQLADRWGGRLPVAGGMAGLAGVMALMALLPETAPLWAVVAVTMGHGLMIGMSLAPLHRAAMQRIDDAETGLAAGLYSMIRFGGQIMGTAIAGVLLQAGLERYAAPVQAYQSVFWIFAGVALLATFAALQIREA